ncbi:MFS transporter [Mycobacterium kiyosense]|uniref:MFS transporter n=2 Tax=Mycobacteriaceae TaxID=1762 RepID=A0A9P3Q5C6_9MYCO|nr:MFS transporter [Mycobacterium kiyosense]BDE16383.1 MFS transporter [Mycobacterium sp. 20KCMC460]GLB84648.1 MFS transporter [Mycobacterium kiyosense]GLB89403.1 MFS transporter [Mycobacterium kiyosense]GLB94901.1 MFS transporter [Mycobacterium kiyosense]
MANYPAGDADHRRSRRPPPMPSSNRYLPPLGHEPPRRDTTPPPPRGFNNGERITVTRAAAMRSREMGSRMYWMVQRAATADGADKSGLTALTWPVMANFAVDSAMAVALANTLFFAAASGESKSKVALYLLITIAPFAVIAPLIGPALDKLQHGRRVALALSFALRTALALVLIINYDGASGSFPSWVLYPCALAMMVFSKSFSVLRSAVTPRVMPPSIDLVRVNSRLTVFGLLGGTIAGGAVAAGVEFACTHLFKLPGALFVVVGITIAGALLSMRIPSWVEVTAGEVPATLSYHRDSDTMRRSWHTEAKPVKEKPRQPLGRNIITSLWGNCTIKVMVGFLFLYPAFVAKAHDADGWVQLAMLGMIGAAAAIGNFAGNFASARLKLGRPAVLVVRCTLVVTAFALAAAVAGHLIAVVVATLFTSGSSAIAKASLDASLQNDLPEESRASGFGRSESTLQLAWVLGGALGVLVYTDLWVGFTAVSALLILGLAQTVVSFQGRSLIPGLGGNRPIMVEQEGWHRGAPETRVTPQ